MNLATEAGASVVLAARAQQDPAATGPIPSDDSGNERRSPGPRDQFLLALAVTAIVLALGLLLHMLLIGRIQYSASQQQLGDQLRAALAQGTAPVSGIDQDGRPLKSGTAVALLEIERLGLREVIVEGTASEDLFRGPGHRRDTVLPGQAGNSVVHGRRFLFGGPFASIDSLRRTDQVVVTTAQGTFRFSVLGIRRAGDPLPEPLERGEARLVLVTSSGSLLIPEAPLYVDTQLNGQAVAPGPIGVTALPGEESEFSGDTRSIAVLALWLQALALVASGALWSWWRWGRVQAWVVFTPILLTVGVRAGGELLKLIPNLV